MDDVLTVAAVADMNAFVKAGQEKTRGSFAQDLEDQHQEIFEGMQDQHEARRVLLGDLPDMQSGLMPTEEAVRAEMTGYQDAVRDLSDASEAILAAPGVGEEMIENLSDAQRLLWEEQCTATRLANREARARGADV